MKYYLHDSNSFNDEKITELFMNFGYEGLGLFYTILEKLASQEKPVKTIVLKAQLKVGKRLEKCWLFMEEIELISSNNGETFNKQLLSFSEKYKIKKEKNSKRISEWRNNQAIKENVTCNEHVCNTDKINRSKVNEIEEKENIKELCVFSDSELHFKIMKYFNFTEQLNPDKLSNLFNFLNILQTDEQIDHFTNQFEAYRNYKTTSKEIVHSFAGFLGTIENRYLDGGWNAENWNAKLKNFNAKTQNQGAETLAEYNKRIRESLKHKIYEKA